MPSAASASTMAWVDAQLGERLGLRDLRDVDVGDGVAARVELGGFGLRGVGLGGQGLLRG